MMASSGLSCLFSVVAHLPRARPGKTSSVLNLEPQFGQKMVLENEFIFHHSATERASQRQPFDRYQSHVCALRRRTLAHFSIKTAENPQTALKLSCISLSHTDSNAKTISGVKGCVLHAKLSCLSHSSLTCSYHVQKNGKLPPTWIWTTWWKKNL